MIDSEHVEPRPENYEQFIEIIKNTSRKVIPTGCRQQYVPGMYSESKERLKKYETLYTAYPFSEETVDCGTALLQKLIQGKKKKWTKTLEK